jgi:hypothetical protein
MRSAHMPNVFLEGKKEFTALRGVPERRIDFCFSLFLLEGKKEFTALRGVPERPTDCCFSLSLFFFLSLILVFSFKIVIFSGYLLLLLPMSFRHTP